MNAHGYRTQALVLSLILLLIPACNKSLDNGSQESAAVGTAAVSEAAPAEVQTADQTAGCLPDEVTSLEGQTITAGGTDLEVLSVSAAVIDLAQHLGPAAIEGGVATIPDDDSALILNCVSQVY